REGSDPAARPAHRPRRGALVAARGTRQPPGGPPHGAAGGGDRAPSPAVVAVSVRAPGLGRATRSQRRATRPRDRRREHGPPPPRRAVLRRSRRRRRRWPARESARRSTPPCAPPCARTAATAATRGC